MLVHVFMYYYYMLQACHFTVAWKKYLTLMQITQFILDEMGARMRASAAARRAEYACDTHTRCVCRVLRTPPPANVGYIYIHSYYGRLCHGTTFSAAFGLGVIGSFLGLFLDFYKSTYKKSGKGDAAVE